MHKQRQPEWRRLKRCTQWQAYRQPGNSHDNCRSTTISLDKSSSSVLLLFLVRPSSLPLMTRTHTRTHRAFHCWAQMVYYVHNGIVCWTVLGYNELFKVVWTSQQRQQERDRTMQRNVQKKNRQTEANGSLPHLVMYHKNPLNLLYILG